MTLDTESGAPSPEDDLDLFFLLLRDADLGYSLFSLKFCRSYSFMVLPTGTAALVARLRSLYDLLNCLVAFKSCVTDKVRCQEEAGFS